MIARGSPNSFFEAVVMNVPLIITGALPGQEQGNPELVERYGLGIVSKGVKQLPAAVKRLLADDGRELARIRDSQQKYRRFDNAKRIAEAARDLALGRCASLRARETPPRGRACALRPARCCVLRGQSVRFGRFFAFRVSCPAPPVRGKCPCRAACCSPASPARQLHSMMEHRRFRGRRCPSPDSGSRGSAYISREARRRTSSALSQFGSWKAACSFVPVSGMVGIVAHAAHRWRRS